MLSHFSLSFSSLLLSFSISKHFLTTCFPIHELPAKISLLFDSFNFSIRYTSLLGFHYSSISKESACSAGDPGSNPGLGRSPGEANGNPLRSSCPETSMVRGAWWVQHMGSRRAGHDWAVVLSVYVNSSRGPCATAACFPVLPTGTFSTQLWVTSALGPSQALAPSGGLRCSVFSRVPCLLWRQHSSHFTGPV